MAEVMQNCNICFKNSTSFIQLQNILVCLVDCLKAYRHLRALLTQSGLYPFRKFSHLCNERTGGQPA